MHFLERAIIKKCNDFGAGGVSVAIGELAAGLKIDLEKVPKKYAGLDELFTADGFKAYAEDLLERMPNPFLQDAVARITRDLPRKLSWEDRVVGTMRLVLSQNEVPRVFAKGAALAAKEEFGADAAAVKAGLQELWGKWDDEAQKVWELIEKNL